LFDFPLNGKNDNFDEIYIIVQKTVLDVNLIIAQDAPTLFSTATSLIFIIDRVIWIFISHGHDRDHGDLGPVRGLSLASE